MLTHFFLFSLLCASFALGALPLALESRYAEAILAYREKDYSKTLELLRPGLNSEKPPVSFLELEALTLKSLGRTEEVVQRYERLIKTVSPSGAMTMESAPYEFELGMARLQQKEVLKARDHLSNAARFGFNRPACLFTIGTIEFNRKNYTSARSRFQEVLRSNTDSLKAPAHLYLGNIGFETGSPREGYKNLYAARELASSMVTTASDSEKALLSQTLEAASRVLNQGSKAAFRGTVGVQAGYDSNVLLLPSASSVASSTASGQGSLRTALVFGLAYGGSPLSRPQLALDYQGAINLNTNADTRTGQYFTHAVEFRATANPLDKVVFGAKVSPSFLFRVAEADTDAAGRFAPFLTAASFTPFVKYEVEPQTEIGLEATAYFQHYFQDTTTDADYRKSGLGGRVRAYWKNETKKSHWNPTVALSFDLVNTLGNEYRAKTISAELSNAIFLGDAFRIVPAASLGVSYFTERASGFRRDIPFNVSVGGIYDWTNRWSLSATLLYSNNSSTDSATYQYSRFAGNFGLNYVF